MSCLRQNINGISCTSIFTQNLRKRIKRFQNIRVTEYDGHEGENADSVETLDRALALLRRRDEGNGREERERQQKLLKLV